jgi:hypothetical protein
MKKLLIAMCAAGCVMTAQAADILGDTIKVSATFPAIPRLGIPSWTTQLGTKPIIAGGQNFSSSPSFNVAVDSTAITFAIGENTSFNAGPYITLQNLSGVFPGVYELTSSSASGFSSADISTVGDTVTLNFGSTAYGTGGKAIFTLVPTVSAVPEPETMAMLLAGLGLVGSIAGRRRRAVGRPVVQPA